MHDNLNLKQLAKLANRQRLWSRFTAFLSFAVLIGSIASVFLTSGGSDQMYVRTGNNWQSVQGYTGGARAIGTAPDGNTWLLTNNPITLNRWVDNKWQPYPNSVVEETDCICEMAFDEGNIWITSDKGVLKFDGKKWSNYPDATRSRPVSIAVSYSGVYVIDVRGNLSQLDGQVWSITNVRDILPNLRLTGDDDYPLVFAADDGSLLLRWNGIWHFDDDNWQEVQINKSYLNHKGLIGTAHNHMWTEWSNGIVVSELDGSNWRSFEMSTLGLSAEGRVYKVSEYGDGYLFETNAGLISYDGQEWTHLAMPNNQNLSIGRISASHDGTIWLIVDQSDTVIAWLVVAITLTVIVVGFFITIIVNTSRNTKRLRSARTLLGQSLPATPSSPKPRNSNWVLLGIIFLIIIEMGAAFAGQPNLANTITPLLFILLCVWFARRTMQFSGSFKQRLLRSWPLGLFIIWIFGVWIGAQWLGSIHSQLGGPFYTVWIIIGFIPCALSIIRAVRKYTGDNAYQNTTKEFSKSNLSAAQQIQLKALHANTSLLAGHLEESENSARASIAESQYTNIVALSNSLNTLGLALMYQKHYEEAIKFIEIAIQISPTSGSILTSLAEVYLEAGVETERALEVIQFARRYGQENWLIKLFKQSSRPVAEGVYAWILARLGRFEEADQHIQKAMKAEKPKNKPSVAYLYFIKGKIEATKGNPSAAAEWLTRASQSDIGLYGQMAANALKELPTNP